MTSPLPSIKFLPQGALIQEILIGGKNIVLGFPNPEDYTQHNAPYFGETIGRIANRISGAQIDSLNGGQSYELAANNGANSLHGGPLGWGKRIWKASNEKRKDGAGKEREALKFEYASEHLEEGFPGTVKATVWYLPRVETINGVEKTFLEMEYEAELVGDEVEETVVAMTNHSYFNLSQAPNIAGTEVTLSTTEFLEVDNGGIPSGTIKHFPNLTAKTPFTLGEQEPDIDDCFVLPSTSTPNSIDTRDEAQTLLIRLHNPNTKLHLEILSTEPAFQFYTGKYVSTPELRNGEVSAKGARSGFCVEPSRYVNAVNVPEWKGQVLLKKGEKYGTRITYVAWEE